MTAYVILDINLTDPSGYEEYKKLAPEYSEARKMRLQIWL